MAMEIYDPMFDFGKTAKQERNMAWAAKQYIGKHRDRFTASGQDVKSAQGTMPQVSPTQIERAKRLQQAGYMRI